MKKKRDKLITIRATKEEREEFYSLAESEGHNSFSAFVKWLIHQYKNKKLRNIE